MSRPIISASKTDCTLTHTSFLEAQLSFIGHSPHHKHAQIVIALQNISLYWLPATTCVITQATKQMWENDLGVEITAETWREIWQNAKRICLSSSTEKNSATTARLPVEDVKIYAVSIHSVRWQKTPTTAACGCDHKVVHWWSNIAQELESIFVVGCDVNPSFSVFLVESSYTIVLIMTCKAL